MSHHHKEVKAIHSASSGQDLELQVPEPTQQGQGALHSALGKEETWEMKWPVSLKSVINLRDLGKILGDLVPPVRLWNPKSGVVPGRETTWVQPQG